MQLALSLLPCLHQRLPSLFPAQAFQLTLSLKFFFPLLLFPSSEQASAHCRGLCQQGSSHSGMGLPMYHLSRTSHSLFLTLQCSDVPFHRSISADGILHPA